MQSIHKKHLVGLSFVTCYLPIVALALIVGMTARVNAQPASPVALTGEAGFTKDRYISFDPSTNGALLVGFRVTRVGNAAPWYVSCSLRNDRGPDGYISRLIPIP